MTASNDHSDRATQPVEAERSQPSFPSRSSMGDETNKSLAGGASAENVAEVVRLRTSAQDAAATQTANVGRWIRDYELLELLGQGGMGSVWKAKHTRLKRMVALKLLPPERMSDAAAVARFHREMEAVGQLRHPHIIEALDAGEEAGTHYLVMEFVEGMELAALSKKVGPLPIADACELMRQTALGLQHAFEHGLVHRDIKPSNLFLCSPVAPRQDSRTSPDVIRATDSHPPSEPQRASGFPVAERQGYFEAPHIKILDLGLALLQGDVATGSDLTSTGQVMGSLDYIAPEQLADTHAVDIRADLYSLGCTLYRLLTGEPPFSSATLNTAAKKIYAHSFTPPPSLLARRPDAPPELSALVNRLLAKKPDERFATPTKSPPRSLRCVPDTICPGSWTPRALWNQMFNRNAIDARGPRAPQERGSATDDNSRIEARDHAHRASGSGCSDEVAANDVLFFGNRASWNAHSRFARMIP